MNTAAFDFRNKAYESDVEPPDRARGKESAFDSPIASPSKLVLQPGIYNIQEENPTWDNLNKQSLKYLGRIFTSWMCSLMARESLLKEKILPVEGEAHPTKTKIIAFRFLNHWWPSKLKISKAPPSPDKSSNANVGGDIASSNKILLKLKLPSCNCLFERPFEWPEETMSKEPVSLPIAYFGKTLLPLEQFSLWWSQSKASLSYSCDVYNTDGSVVFCAWKNDQVFILIEFSLTLRSIDWTPSAKNGFLEYSFHISSEDLQRESESSLQYKNLRSLGESAKLKSSQGGSMVRM